MEMEKLTTVDIEWDFEEMAGGGFEAIYSLEELGIENNPAGEEELESLEELAEDNNWEIWFDFGDDQLRFTLED